jgi:arabinofuranan 3-O-arabinosyltransferase
MLQSTTWARRILFGFAVLNITLLLTAGLKGHWILNSKYQVIPADFVSFWATSRQLQDQPAAHVYDWTLHSVVEADLVGPDYKKNYPWVNPPTFLFAVAPLAFLPYSIAFLSWCVATFALYAASLRAILPSRWTLIGACAFPATLWTAGVGQNGFLSTALIGGVLGSLDRRPLLAGFFLGLLTYKPQFGILFPIVLAASGRWRVIAAASLTTILLIVMTGWIYGIETWYAFLDSIPKTEKMVLSDGRMGFYKLQSFYGAVLWLGGSLAAAWTIQGIITIAAMILVTWIWRSRASSEVKCAALGVGILAATPYVLIYDFPILLVPIVFLVKASISRISNASGIMLIVSSSILILLFPWAKAPIGVLAVCLIAIAIAQRAIIENNLNGLALTTPPLAAP